MASVVYRVLKENASTVLLTTVVALTVTAWSLTKTRCGGVRTKKPSRHKLKDHAAAALDRDPTDVEKMTGIVMTDGAMYSTIDYWKQRDVIIVKAMNQQNGIRKLEWLHR